MKPKRLKRVPALIGFVIVSLCFLLRFLELDLPERLERVTYDMRVRAARQFPSMVATNLGFVFIDESSIETVRKGALGYKYGLYWPRQVYGRLVEELFAQDAKLVAFDVIFGEIRNDHPLATMADGSRMESDEFFALQLRRASNVILALTRELAPPPLFATNALAVGDISTDRDSDGILRRVKVFRTYRKWHSAFRQLEDDPDYGVDLRRAQVFRNRIVLPRALGESITIPLDAKGDFSLADFGGDKIPAGVAPKQKPFTDERVWHMGVKMAALHLGLELEKAEFDLAHGRITLRGPNGLLRGIPVDQDGYFLIDWSVPLESTSLTRQSIQAVLWQDTFRISGKTNDLKNVWRDKLVVVGSSALANDLSDRGATPLQADTLLVSKHWNVASSVLTGRFIQKSALYQDLLILALLVSFTGYITWQTRTSIASAIALLLITAYLSIAVSLYLNARIWIPIVLPFCAVILSFVSIMTWRVVVEQAERRRIRSLFSKMVSPKIVSELLATDTLALGGARRDITVFFADVRGFTELTDNAQQQVAEYVERNKLTGAAAEACFDDQAKQTLATVNLYLGVVANTIISNYGTLDKFIGDCVMAFWGAPTPNPRHASSAIRAAIAAQRAVFDLNQEREEENSRRKLENIARTSKGAEPLPLLPILTLGSGLNSGPATAGLMGSEESESLSYTVFGREVNLASRLEGASGKGRIFISQPTYEHLLRDDPALASTCRALDPIAVKGFRAPVSIFEVPWRPALELQERLKGTGQENRKEMVGGESV